VGVQAELLDLLANMPGVDTHADRKAFIAYAGFPHLGIYLDLEGAPVQFAQRLVEELSRRGKGEMLGFVTALNDTLQVSEDRKKMVADIRSEIQALDDAGFALEFGVAPAPVAPVGPADPDLLAITVVSQVLTPYYDLGPDGLREKTGDSAVQMAEAMAEKVETAFAEDAAAGPIFGVFKTQPKALQAAVLKELKARLDDDLALAGQLAELLASSAKEPDGAVERLLVEVAMDLGLVQNSDVIGATIGKDRLTGLFKVTQTIKTVKDSKVVGVEIK
jgi:hypothetical protein